MNTILEIMALLTGCQYFMGFCKGDKSSLGTNPHLTDTGIKVAGLSALIVVIHAFYYKSWVLLLSAFITCLFVSDTLSEMEKHKINNTVITIRTMIIMLLILWRLQTK